jgi:serine phosphatase RsbU (regulator of sigma subunit)
MTAQAAVAIARADRRAPVRRKAKATAERPRALAVGPAAFREELRALVDLRAATPDEAVRAIAGGGVALLLVDAALPAGRLRGLLAAAALRTPRPAVIAWTERSTRRRAAALAGSVDDLIDVQVGPSEACARVQATLRLGRYLGEIARHQAELATLRRQMDVQARRMAEDLRLASGIQRSLLPAPVDHQHLDLAREFLPYRDIGGDYYDFVPLGAAGMALALGDVMGKGVPAALLAATLKASVRSHLQTGEESWRELVSRINRMFWEVTPVGLFASLFFGVVDAAGRVLDYVNAGHFHPFVLHRDGQVRDLDEGGAVLGLVEKAEYAQGRIRLQPGDQIVFYTDGVIERANADGEFYGIERLKDAARRSRGDAARIALYSLLGDLQDWSGGLPAEDDTTLIVVKVR